MSKAKQRALAKSQIKKKNQLKKLEERKIKEQKQRDKFEKDGIKDLSLLAVSRQLKKKEHILAQAGALGINREYLNHTPQKMRMELQAYTGKQIELKGVITEVKFKYGKLIAFMIATPFITVNSHRVVVDSHLWVFFNKMQYTDNADNKFSLALGTYIQIEALIGSYTTDNHVKYGIDAWIINNTGIGYIYPEKNGKILEVNLINEESRLTAPFATVVNKDNDFQITTVSRQEFEIGEKELLKEYDKLKSNIDPLSSRGLRNSAKR